MTSGIPAALRSADIGRFATRAAQVEKSKPAIAYWCRYYMVQQIVTKGLHNRDDDCKTYTSALMDYLETVKSENPDNDAIVDDVAGRAYIEMFGLEVFQRADDAMRAAKATRQTADTFQAAYTFLELLQIWPPLDQEVASKIKFAKFHALRIAKAFKAGEDPNAGQLENLAASRQEEPPVGTDSPAPRTGDQPRESQQSQAHQQASVTEVPDEQDQRKDSLAAPHGQSMPIYPSSSPIPPASPEKAENFYQNTANGEVSPLGPSSATKSPIPGDGYFPPVPEQNQAGQIPGPPAPASAPQAGWPAKIDSPVSPQFSPVPAPTNAPHPGAPRNDLQGMSSQGQPFSSSSGSWDPMMGNAPNLLQNVQAAPVLQYQAHGYPPGQPGFSAPSPAFVHSHQHTPAPNPPAPMAAPPNDEAIALAMKHARWAISALNFEDVPTAVKELREALGLLGGR